MRTRNLQRAETILDDAFDRQHAAIWAVLDEYYAKLNPTGFRSEAIEALADVQATLADALDEWQNCLDRTECKPQGATLQ
jgi:hypothetical protein